MSDRIHAVRLHDGKRPWCVEVDGRRLVMITGVWKRFATSEAAIVAGQRQADALDAVARRATKIAKEQQLMTVSTVKLAAWRSLAEAASEGPWTHRAGNNAPSLMVIDANGMWVADCGDAPRDAAFIAVARTALPELIDEVARLRELLVNATNALEGPGDVAQRRFAAAAIRTKAEQ